MSRYTTNLCRPFLDDIRSCASKRSSSSGSVEAGNNAAEQCHPALVADICGHGVAAQAVAESVYASQDQQLQQLAVVVAAVVAVVAAVVAADVAIVVVAAAVAEESVTTFQLGSARLVPIFK